LRRGGGSTSSAAQRSLNLTRSLEQTAETRKRDSGFLGIARTPLLGFLSHQCFFMLPLDDDHGGRRDTDGELPQPELHSRKCQFDFIEVNVMKCANGFSPSWFEMRV